VSFEEILDQAITMLQRRGRLTYGTLKRQFQLDDAALEVRLLIARTEGNPFFLEESVRTLVETGLLVGAPGAPRRCRTAAHAGAGIEHCHRNGYLSAAL
jgi:hypothetical protein